MQYAIVIAIVAAAMLFMARRIMRQWKGGNSCGCGNKECTCGKNNNDKRHPNEGSAASEKLVNNCCDCPLHNKCNYCQ